MTRLYCSDCACKPPPEALFCPSCNGLLAFELGNVGLSTPVLRDIFHLRRGSNEPLDRSGVWRYRELLPHVPAKAVVTLRENDVPLYAARAGAEYADARKVAYLHLGMNPTASFKDAGMTVAISHAKATGARLAVCASTGNTAAAMAAYAARAGIAAIVLVPYGGISEAKLAQTLDYGATVAGIDGDFDSALAVVRKLDPRRVAIVNSVNPYRIEGQKCVAFTLLEQRGWSVPDWVIVPGGNLGNASALGKGFREARALGLIDRLPRLGVVQAAGAAPFAQLFANGGVLKPVKAETSASAIRIGAPASWRKALAEVRASEGTVTAVDDAAIADARAIVGRDGVGCEPASAATLAGLRALRTSGHIGRDEDVVLVLTGHVLKDGAYAAAYHASSASLANRIVDARGEAPLRALLERALPAHA